MNTLFTSLPMHHRVRFREIVLFVSVGVLNTVVDFAVLNLLIVFTHRDQGGWLLVFNVLSFLAAVLNSYVLNGRFTFRSSGPADSWRFIRFVMVNAVGLIINSITVLALSPVFGGLVSTLIAINVSKALATLLSLCWNYFAIKRWIFRAEIPMRNNESEEGVTVVSTTLGSEIHHEI